MLAVRTIYRKQIPLEERILEPSDIALAPVREATMYPAQFPILLRERLQGKTVAQAAEFLGVPPEQVQRLLEGQWKPTKGICRKMGLKVVYAVSERPQTPIS